MKLRNFLLLQTQSLRKVSNSRKLTSLTTSESPKETPPLISKYSIDCYKYKFFLQTNYTEEDITNLNKMIPNYLKKNISTGLNLKQKIKRNHLKFFSFVDEEINEDFDRVEIDVEKFKLKDYLLKLYFHPSEDKRDYFPKYMCRLIVLAIFLKVFNVLAKIYREQIAPREQNTILHKKHSLGNSFYFVEKELQTQFSDIISDLKDPN